MRSQTATVLPLIPPSQTSNDAADLETLPVRAGVRLEVTRRGRFLVSVLAFLLGLVVATIVLVAFDLPSALAEESREPTTVTVESGDTLSALAVDHAPEGMSQEQFITEVRTLNNLSTARVTAGQEIELPQGD